MNPAEVRSNVTATWWLRWNTWRKAQASRSAWKDWKTNGSDAAGQKGIRLWAMNKDEY